jgi:hypothetical protein
MTDERTTDPRATKRHAKRGRTAQPAPRAHTQAPAAPLAPAPQGAPHDEAMPEDMNAFRLDMTRRLHTLAGNPRRCRERACRRARRCVGADFRCLRDFPAPAMSPEEEARARARFLGALRRRLAELDVS